MPGLPHLTFPSLLILYKNHLVTSVLLGGCIESTDRHTKENLRGLLELETEKWGIFKKINVCVTDSAANIKAAVGLIPQWKNFNCVAHTINLVVRVAIENVGGVQSLMYMCICFFSHPLILHYDIWHLCYPHKS